MKESFKNIDIDREKIISRNRHLVLSQIFPSSFYQFTIKSDSNSNAILNEL